MIIKEKVCDKCPLIIIQREEEGRNQFKFPQELEGRGLRLVGRSNWPLSITQRGGVSVDHPIANLFSWNIYDVGYPKGLKNGNFKFFCQISSSSRPFLLIFCQNFFFQKIDLYPFNFELSCSHQFLTENDPPYHFGKGRCILRC